MKRFFLFILVLTAFVSCGGDVCGGCKNWETCNTETSKCELKSGKCEDSTNCDWGYMCNAEHNCIDENNPCEGVSCDEWKSCNNDNGVCELTEGRCLKNDDCTENKICNESHYCVVKSCTDNETTEISCGLNDNGLQTQKCVNKVWINEGVCVDSDICKNGQKKAGTTSCGVTGNFYQQICENGKWVNTNICINPSYFITTWKTDNEGGSLPTQVTIHINTDYTYNYKIDCNNDGIWEAENVTTSYTCNYETAGIYHITITGIFPAIYNYNNGILKTDNKKLISVDQWGNNKWETMEHSFSGCSNLSINASDKPDLSNVTSMKEMFSSNYIFNENINSWDVSNVKDMSWMFWHCKKFNQDLSSWNVNNVTNMQGMFSNALEFNKNINSWNVSNVTNMNMMFSVAKAFNQELNNWNVSKVTDMGDMFALAESFNKDLNSWDIGNVNYMGGMFSGAVLFNGKIDNWNVSNVKSMIDMFKNATSFNQPIGKWNVSNVTDMSGIFQNATSFNQDLSNWNVENVTSCYVFDMDATTWTLPKPNFTQCNPE